MRRFAPLMLLLLGATAPAMPTDVRLEQRARAQAEAADEILIYRAKSGDTLPGLAQRWFLNPGDWRKAAALNGISGAGPIPAGTPLKLRAGWIRTTPIRAELAAVRGDVRVLRGGAALPVSKGMALAEGDIIETGPNGYATLKLPDLSKVSLPSASRIRLARLRMVPMSDSIDRRFALEQGRSDARVTPMANPASRFMISTPVAVAAVRGTEFSVTYTPGEMKAATAVSEGKVAVGRSAGAGEVLLLEGFGNLATDKGSGRPVKLLAAPPVETPDQLQDSEEVAFRITPVPGAVRYLVEIAADEAFEDRLGSIEIEGDLARFADVPNGRYFVRAFAVDAMGLTGMPTDPVSFERDWEGNRSAEQSGEALARDQLAGLGFGGNGNFAWFAGGGAGGVEGQDSGEAGAEGDAAYTDAELGTDEPIAPLPEGFTLTPPEAGSTGAGLGGGGSLFGGGSGGFGGGGGFAGGGAGGGGAGGGPGGGGGGGAGSGGGSGPGSGESSGGGEGPTIVVTDPAPPVPPPPAPPPPGLGGDPGGPPVSGPPTVPPTAPPSAPAIPEPATWALLIAGFGLVGHSLRRRRALAHRS
jgi:hypothetical protein